MDDNLPTDSSEKNRTADGQQPNELELLTRILSDLQKLSLESREKLLQTVATYFGFSFRSGQLTGRAGSVQDMGTAEEPSRSFSEDRSIPPKQFMAEKQPKTDVERVACLAYYLTHFRQTPHFKTLDISKINTESAQIKFSNPTVAVENAAKMGYLVPASKGSKQISHIGEQFVQALPDREKAKAIMTQARPRRKKRRVADQEQTS